ncbi:Kinesin-related protein 1 [Symbiodinium microadriaticum]|uniref:Kinesin-related protein 1 n=1 Tax=Symbiodinium microadriaticum TaxID=2951 RepID=A0A1Q9CPB3_SYMMI|nr:Kinesin-related protein 1 [Symbiodinium microadriaticum]
MGCRPWLLKGKRHLFPPTESMVQITVRLPDAMKSGGLSKLQSAVSQVKQVNALKGDAALEDSPTIKVCVRVRPFIKEEVEGQRSGGECKLCVEMPTETSVRMWNPEEIEEDMRGFEFDRCYWSHSSDNPLYATQETLQKELGETMLEHAMNGFNNCIFAYGQTGSGKSYSVLGGKGEERGLLPRVVEGLFDHFEKLPEGATYKTLVAFMEIYNEQIRDLLAPATDSENKKLEVKQHPVLGTIVPGLTEAAVASCEEVLNLVDYGTQMRHVSAAAMNATSSRSHCIFTFKTSLTEPDQPSKVSQTHLVDLAGSERAGRTKATGDRLKEGAAINQSLSTLARVISELAKSSKTKKKPNPPFRESKLTYILKESLCGNSKTVMMAAISPNFLDFDETLSTLKFAQSVKQVQTKAVQNAVNMSSVEAQLRAELNALKSQLKMYEDGSPTSSANVSSEELVFLKRRLEEQEQFCAYYGKDWDSLLAEERERMDTRRTSLHPSKLGDRVKKSPSDKRQDHSSDEDADMEEDQESITCSLLELGKPPDVLPPGGRPSLCAPIRSSLAVVGPMAQSLLREGARPRAENLNRRLLELSQLAEETQELLNRENGGEMSIQVLVVVDPLDEETFEAGLVVQAASSKSLPSSWAWPRNESSEASETGERKVDWCSATELKKRLNWLKSNVSNSTRSAEETWLAAARATSGYDALEALQKDNAAMVAKIAELESRLREAEGPRRAEKEGPKLRSQKARDAVKAIAASFETALGAIDSAQLTLQKVNSTSV